MGKKAIRAYIVLGFLAITLISCSIQNQRVENGYLTMMPYENRAMAYQAMIPLGWQEVDTGEFSPGSNQSAPIQLILVGIPDTHIADLENLAVTQLGIEKLPMIQRNYTSRTLTWDLYEFQTDSLSVPDVHVLLALAEGDHASYAVAMIAITDTFLEGPALYETIFLHAVHGLSPLE
jgi:hypothetical protein